MTGEPRILSAELNSGDDGKRDLYFRNISLNSAADA